MDVRDRPVRADVRALIVGASSGIGAVTRKLLDDRGWQVDAIDRTSGVDVTDEATYAKALAWYLVTSQPDAIVYAAGHVRVAPLADTTTEEWRYTLDVNVTGAYRLLAQVARHRRPCAVVLVASTAGTRPSPEWGPYAASKAALINLGLSAHAELAEYGIRVYVLTPGRCATPLRAVLAPDEDPATIMQPDEVAASIATMIDDTDGVLAGAPIRVAR